MKIPQGWGFQKGPKPLTAVPGSPPPTPRLLDATKDCLLGRPRRKHPADQPYRTLQVAEVCDESGWTPAPIPWRASFHSCRVSTGGINPILAYICRIYMYILILVRVSPKFLIKWQGMAILFGGEACNVRGEPVFSVMVLWKVRLSWESGDVNPML